MLQRIIPSSGEALPVIGLGTWQTFDVQDEEAYPVLENVLNELHSAGGRLLDSSPMYGKAEQVIGDISSGMPVADDFFYATKVWTTGLQEGIREMEASFRKMRRRRMDLMQIHNLLDWQTHLPQLRAMKEQGKIRYIGITHYTDESHAALENVLRNEQIDFVQLNYSITSRHAEKRLLDAAADLGVATLINRPFGQGNLFGTVKGKTLPPWSADLGITSWAAYFLKYILANSAVTCVIPATGNPVHAAEFVEAGTGVLPDEPMKKKMLAYLESI
jgi:diketogulonate reductase-like aldo/keto reductase